MTVLEHPAMMMMLLLLLLSTFNATTIPVKYLRHRTTIPVKYLKHGWIYSCGQISTASMDPLSVDDGRWAYVVARIHLNSTMKTFNVIVVAAARTVCW